MNRALDQLRALLAPRDKWRCLALAALMAVGAGLELLGIGLVMPVVAALTKPELLEQNAPLRFLRGLFPPESNHAFAIAAAAAVAVVFAGKNLYLFAVTRRQTRFVLAKTEELANRLFDRYLQAPYAYHLAGAASDRVVNVRRVEPALRGTLLPLLALSSEALVVAAMFAALLYFAPLTSMAVAGLGGLSLAAGHVPLKNRLEILGARRRRAGDRLHKTMTEAFGGIKEIKLRHAEAVFARRHAELEHAEKTADADAHILSQIPRFFIEAFTVAVVMAALAASLAAGVADGTVLLRFTLLALAMVRIMPSLSRIQYALATIRQHRTELDLLHRDLSGAPPEGGAAAEAAATAPPLSFARSLAAADLGFCYPGAARPVFSGLSFELPRNSSTAFVGPTGAGKTTLLDTLLGLLEPTAGRVLVDGRDLRENPRSWRERTGYVPQHVFLLDDTVLANVAFGVEPGEVDEERVREALAVAQADDFVAALPQGWHTPVGDLGGRLSGGQRQRVAIARALYRRPEVLALDEATSALDAGTERAFADALVSLRGKLTILLVAHRPTTVALCETVIRLDGSTEC